MTLTINKNTYKVTSVQFGSWSKVIVAKGLSREEAEEIVTDHQKNGDPYEVLNIEPEKDDVLLCSDS